MDLLNNLSSALSDDGSEIASSLTGDSSVESFVSVNSVSEQNYLLDSFLDEDPESEYHPYSSPIRMDARRRRDNERKRRARNNGIVVLLGTVNDSSKYLAGRRETSGGLSFCRSARPSHIPDNVETTSIDEFVSQNQSILYLSTDPDPLSKNIKVCAK